VLSTYDQDGQPIEREWDPSVWVDVDGKPDFTAWHLANRGYVYDALGWAWPMCPRWYEREATDTQRAWVNVIAKYASWRSRSSLRDHLGDVTLTPFALGLIDTIDRLRSYIPPPKPRDDGPKPKPRRRKRRA
jgi:hypothetical protein